MPDGNQASYYRSFMHTTSTSLKVVFIQKYNNVPPQLTQTKSEGVIMTGSFRGEEQMDKRERRRGDQEETPSVVICMCT